LNIKAVLLDTAADAGAAAGVAVTGAIIFVTGRWNWSTPPSR
jgi:cobalt-zinc-cadmium efflux system protein